jgi:hypothetical protein
MRSKTLLVWLLLCLPATNTTQVASTFAAAPRSPATGPSSKPTPAQLVEGGERAFATLDAALKQLDLSVEERKEVATLLERRRASMREAAANLTAGKMDSGVFAGALRASLDISPELRKIIGDDRFIAFSRIWAQTRRERNDPIRDELLPQLQAAAAKLELTDTQKQNLAKLWAQIDDSRQRDEQQIAQAPSDVDLRRRLGEALAARIVAGLKEILNADQYDQLMKLLPAPRPSTRPGTSSTSKPAPAS